jgi:protein SCO1/2
MKLLETIFRGGKCWLVMRMLLALTLTPGRACSQPLLDADLAKITFEQKLNARLPLNLDFVDETGRGVRLGEYFGSKPIVLVLGYYGCPMLCTLVLNGLVESLQDLKWRAGSEFAIVNLSIDPEESPALAAKKKRTYLKRYGRAEGPEGWHFLTGKTPEIHALAQAIGFGYRFDPLTKQYAHPSGFVVVTPQGKVARYFFGVTFPSSEVYAALRDASQNKPGSPIQQLILLCFHYNPLNGRYSARILEIIRWLSLGTVVGLAAVILISVRRTRRL